MSKWQELKDWLKNRKDYGWGSLTISVLLEKMEQLEGEEERDENIQRNV